MADNWGTGNEFWIPIFRGLILSSVLQTKWCACAAGTAWYNKVWQFLRGAGGVGTSVLAVSKDIIYIVAEKIIDHTFQKGPNILNVVRLATMLLWMLVITYWGRRDGRLELRPLKFVIKKMIASDSILCRCSRQTFHYVKIAYDIPVWISSVTIPSNQCGWMSSRTASVGEQNCNNLLPFVCEKGTLPYREPLLWRRDFLIACICLIALLTIIAAIACCACQRAQRKAQQFPHQKTFLRDNRQNVLTTLHLSHRSALPAFCLKKRLVHLQHQHCQRQFHHQQQNMRVAATVLFPQMHIAFHWHHRAQHVHVQFVVAVILQQIRRLPHIFPPGNTLCLKLN
uniref:Uncharacterized protein n=1 Tax=Globodera rostochiensis TaxID=31243 RepID=A0A914H701_GLORO